MRPATFEPPLGRQFPEMLPLQSLAGQTVVVIVSDDHIDGSEVTRLGAPKMVLENALGNRADKDRVGAGGQRRGGAASRAARKTEKSKKHRRPKNPGVAGKERR